MAGRYKAYPEHKDSGVEWIEDLPKNWEVSRTKAMFELSRQLVGKASANYQLLSLTLRGVIPRDISGGGGKIPAEFDTYQVVESDDLIFCLFDIDETPRTVGISPLNGMITGAYNVYKCYPSCSPQYVYYYFMHIDSFKGLRPFYTGLRKVVRADTFSSIKIPNPSLTEQKQIAQFLDHETGKIDALIEKQQALIALLKEKRQAVISHAVTKGLNPNATMKDSGVEWLGEVPEGWEVASLKFYAQVIDCKHITAEFLDAGYPLASIGEVKGWHINLEGAKFTSYKFYSALIEGNREPRGGDIIYSRNATVGEAALVPEEHPEFAMGQDVCLIRLGEALYPEFALHVLKSGLISQQLDVSMIGSTFKRINVDDIRSFTFTLPPIEEQRDLVTKLNEITVQYDDLIDNAQVASDLLQERRTALISAAVTGKIDVRDWEPVPEAQEESEVCSA